MRVNSLALSLAVALPLAVVYLIWQPPAGDLAAATYRADLFTRVGFSAWDTGWYAAHGYWLPSYSLLSPALGALCGVRVLLAISAVASAVLFAAIAGRAFGERAAPVACATFALGVSVGMLSGRVPYYLGLALALSAVLALTGARRGTALVPSGARQRAALAPSGTRRGAALTPSGARLAAALALAALAGVASPVAGAFLALAGAALALAGEARNGLALCAAALAPALVLSLAYPNGGYEPFAASAFWPAVVGVTLIALLLPRGALTPRAHRALRIGAALYALVLVGAYAVHTPLGGNAARLGALLAAPLLAGVLWERRRAMLFGLAPILLYWQLATPIRDYASIAGDPSTHASYYAPLLAELRTLEHGRRTIVEVPLTKAHWESAYLAGHDGVELARGWERQLDTRYAALFYRATLTASAYRAWLAENRVAFVALPDAPLDKAGALEGRLIDRGLPYLRPVWRSSHWRLYRLDCHPRFGACAIG